MDPLRLLFVTARPPFPSRRGDQARTAGWLRELASRHRVSVLALAPPGFPPCPWPADVDGTVARLSRTGMARALLDHRRLPLQVALHATANARRAVVEAVERARPEVIVPVLSRVGWTLDGDGEAPPAVVDLVDSLGLNMRHRARRQPLLRPVLEHEARRLDDWDRRIARRARFATVVSERDRSALIAGRPELAERIRVLPFGLEVAKSLPGTPADREVVLLSGNLGYFPTVDGARWMAREVWPRLRRRRPEAEWWLAGSRPARAVRRIGATAGVRLVVEPDDLGSVRRQARVAAVPLRAGSGTPIKILEAMADGVPVVTTEAGYRGLDGAPAEAVRVADDAASFADHLEELLADPSAARHQRRAAWEWVRRRHDFKVVAAAFEDLLVRAARG